MDAASPNEGSKAESGEQAEHEQEQPQMAPEFALNLHF
jgi:hypothetical protein